MKDSLFTVLLCATILVISLACGMVGQPSLTQAPTSSIYATALSVGGTHAYALLNTGHVMCWGDNSVGQLGDGTYTKHPTATEVPGLTDVISIAAGGEFTCALTKDKMVKCWGSNASGQLENGTGETGMAPADVPGLTNVSVISTGNEHACAVIDKGALICWGKNLNGRVGDGSYTRLILSPTEVAGLRTPVTGVSAGNEYTCALTANGGVKCWGRNTEGELGNGRENPQSKSPVDVVGIDDKAILLTTGFSKSCAILKDGHAKCWGWIGPHEFSNEPVELTGLNGNAKLVAAGGNHICVVLENGNVKCMGENTKGKLGNGTNTDSQRYVDVKGLSIQVTAIGAAYDYTCALTIAGEVWCWGDNAAGQLGNGTTDNSSTPIKVMGINQ